MLWKTRVSLSGVLFSCFSMLSLCMCVCDKPCRGQRVQGLPLGLLWKTQLLAQVSGCESQKVDAQKQRSGGSTFSLDSRSFSRALRASTNLWTQTVRLSATLCRRFSASLKTQNLTQKLKTQNKVVDMFRGLCSKLIYTKHKYLITGRCQGHNFSCARSITGWSNLEECS